MGIFDWLFNRKNNEPTPQQIEKFKKESNKLSEQYWEDLRNAPISPYPEVAPSDWTIEFTADDARNVCDQMGAFDEQHITDEDTMNKISQEIARCFNKKGWSLKNLEESYIEAMERYGYDVSQGVAQTFVDCFYDAYIANN